MPLERLRRDLLYALRGFRRNPEFAATVVLTFGLGIGATTAIFTVVSGVLLRPLPFPQPDRLVSIKEQFNGPPNVFVGSTEIVEWMRRSTAMSHVGAYFDCSVNLLGADVAERLECGSITQSLLPLLGVQPALGRNFLPEEDRPGGQPAVILSYALWKRRFRADRAILGKTLALDDKAYSVVGVLPEDFRIPGEFRIPQDLWLPFQLEPGRAHWKLAWAVGRLRPGVALESARAELDTIFQATRRTRTSRVVLVPWQEQITAGVRNTLWILLAAVGLVLLVACVNVANLLLARGAAREREIAIRRALGAGSGAILRQMLAESALVAVGGAAAGLLVTFWARGLLVAFLARSLPTVPPIPLDFRVLAFALSLALLCGFGFGLAPALRAARVSVADRLKAASHGAGTGRLRDLLVVVEVALATALMVSAGLLFNSFLRLRGQESGIPADRVLTMYVQLKGARYANPDAQSDFFSRLLEQARNLPGVEGATVAANGFITVGTGEGDIKAEWTSTGPDYLRIMGIPLLSGRNLAASDTAGAPDTILVNRTFAGKYCPDGPCLGKQIANPFRKGSRLTIAGIVGDQRRSLEEEPSPTAYGSYLQNPTDFGKTVLLRTPGDPAGLARALRGILASIDNTQAPALVQTLEESMAREIAPRRINMLLLVAFAALAAMLGAAGIYGVTAHAVSRRTHELGVRIALGAGRRQIAVMIAGRALALVAAGEVAGLAASVGLSRVIAGLLFEVKTTDPATHAAVAILWLVAGAAACLMPTLRAMRLEASSVLRSE